MDVAGYLPAGCRNVLTVAASDTRGNLVERYSNYGDRVEILAPGGDVKADRNGDGIVDGVLSATRNGLELYDGTSMAAPHVSGVVALALASNPSLTPSEVTDLIEQAASPRNQVQCPRPCGAGLLNASFLQ